jgi:uncharacterized membrane protein YhaH (DUF805 family)
LDDGSMTEPAGELPPLPGSVSISLQPPEESRHLAGASQGLANAAEGQSAGFAMTDWWRGEGRMGRASFVIWTLVLVLAMVTLVVPLMNAGLPRPISLIMACPFTLGSIVVAARRLHDMDRSTMHLLWIFGPGFALQAATASHPDAQIGSDLLAFVASVWLFLTPGTPGRNAYGPAPVRAAARAGTAAGGSDAQAANAGSSPDDRAEVRANGGSDDRSGGGSDGGGRGD